MRKTAYGLVFFGLGIALTLNAIAMSRTDWLYVKTVSDVLHTTITDSYGLHKMCELTVTEVPGPGGGGKDEISYRNYECRPFPNSVKDKCDGKNSGFCTTWTGAAYVDYVSVGFAVVALASVLFGVSTRSRRMRIWKALAGLAAAQTASAIITFAMITDTWRRERYPGFQHAHAGPAYVMCLLSWIISLLVTIMIIVNGWAAEKGYRWAVGNRRYEPIR
ncbi:hypothetical protein BKA70DRAFT_1259547 [Coprinopsis sp. MPI-PUGE-AT-0042]|nr:hypothetical protein BKA70DRAFT_1259547 [Coprinopsis sp. MPI-PUGE-AT-0042]